MAQYAAATVVVKVAINAMALPLLGLTGAVVATVVGYLVFITLGAIASRRTMPLTVDAAGIARAALAAGVAALVASQIRLDVLMLDLLARGTCAVVAYLAVLAALDSDARSYLRQAWGMLRGAGSALVLGPAR
jgi:O-antigen/teichoic acid export membrane protein